MDFPRLQKAFHGFMVANAPVLPPELMEALMAKPKLWRARFKQLCGEGPDLGFSLTPVPVMVPKMNGEEAWVANTYLYYPNDGQPHGILGMESFPLDRIGASAKVEKIVLYFFKKQYRQLIRNFDVATCPGQWEESYDARYVAWKNGGPVMQRRDPHGEFFSPSTRYLVFFPNDFDLGPGVAREEISDED